MNRTLLFYCQHSLGIGHLTRSFALCEALSQRFNVILLCGGKLPPTKRPPDGVQVIALPPLGATIDGHLVSHDRRFTVERAFELRRSKILEVFRTSRPEVVLIEFFPFGKKRFSGDLLPLLQEINGLGPAAPVVACSIRDILVGRGGGQEAFDDRASELANDYFDAILVHSDPNFAQLEESFRPRVPLRTPVRYTGFVVPNGMSHNSSAPGRHLLVSAGGGIAGAALLTTAVEAHRLLEDVDMRIIAGPFFPEDAWQDLCRRFGDRPGLSLGRSVPDLGVELRGARASLSQCGYNTALDILRARVPALIVPYAENGEDEQTTRAHRLERLGAVRVLDPADLEPRRLAEEIRALLRFRPRHPRFDLCGGTNTVRILDELHAARFGMRAS
ncbi:MAG TPA: glycosyltransferase [Pseudonocardiaceae bacterium]|nr:glycosyltransferase [Pseudonocardiaceae bacterium]